MILVDTHTHLDSPARRGELPALLRRAAEAQVGWMIAIGTDPGDWDLNRDLARENPGSIRYTVGIHPCSLPDDWEGAVGRIAAFWDGSGGAAPVAGAAGCLGERGRRTLELELRPRPAAGDGGIDIRISSRNSCQPIAILDP